MVRAPTANRIAQSFATVKPPALNTQLPLFSDSMIHHNSHLLSTRIVYRVPGEVGRGYGVSRARRILSPQLLLKKFDLVRKYLQYGIGLSTAEREGVLRLLRLWAYYGQAYPKAAQICGQPGCSPVTFWRAVRRLRDLGLVTVVNRYILRPHAQISNLYRLDRLVLAIARYLAEHGTKFAEKWLRPYLAMPGTLFWRRFFPLQLPGLAGGPAGAG